MDNLLVVAFQRRFKLCDILKLARAYQTQQINPKLGIRKTERFDAIIVNPHDFCVFNAFERLRAQAPAVQFPDDAARQHVDSNFHEPQSHGAT